MRRIVLSLVALATIGLATGTASAGHGYPYGGYYAPGYGGYYGPGYGGYQVAVYVGARPPAPRCYGNDPHSLAVWRIVAEHSRDRYYTHPRSLYNGPPVPPVVYPAWGYGY